MRDSLLALGMEGLRWMLRLGRDVYKHLASTARAYCPFEQIQIDIYDRTTLIIRYLRIPP